MNLDSDVACRSISLLPFTPHAQERSRALQARNGLGEAGMPKSIDPTLVTAARPINKPNNHAWYLYQPNGRSYTSFIPLDTLGKQQAAGF